LNKSASDDASKDWNLGLAWLAALAATLGALFIGEVLGQAPCLLCWYQRIAMFPLTLILGAGVYFGDEKCAMYAKLLAWPGLLTAAWHVGLYYKIVPESIKPCGLGPSCTDAQMLILNIPIPLLSLAAFALILILLHTMKGEHL
jgi:disulfide bond formation protein DsbB